MSISIRNLHYGFHISLSNDSQVPKNYRNYPLTSEPSKRNSTPIKSLIALHYLPAASLNASQPARSKWSAFTAYSHALLFRKHIFSLDGRPQAFRLQELKASPWSRRTTVVGNDDGQGDDDVMIIISASKAIQLPCPRQTHHHRRYAKGQDRSIQRSAAATSAARPRTTVAGPGYSAKRPKQTLWDDFACKVLVQITLKLSPFADCGLRLAGFRRWS